MSALRRRLLKAFHDGGVRVYLGTDSPQIFSVPGFSIHREMRLYVEVGLTPYDVLESGTRMVAEYFDAASDFGTVEVGKRATCCYSKATHWRTSGTLPGARA